MINTGHGYRMGTNYIIYSMTALEESDGQLERQEVIVQERATNAD